MCASYDGAGDAADASLDVGKRIDKLAGKLCGRGGQQEVQNELQASSCTKSSVIIRLRHGVESSSARRESRAASDSTARADERVASAQRSLDAKRAAMVQLFERLKAAGGPIQEGMDSSNPHDLLVVSESVRAAEAEKELTESGTVVHELRVGSRVLVHGLTGATQHNLNRGQVTALPGEGEDRYSIFMEGSRERIRVRGRNLCDTSDLHRAVGLLPPV